MDASTLSAIAASGAALVAATVAIIQFYIGRKQSEATLLAAKAAMLNARTTGQYRVAGFRQEWINTVRDVLCEYHSIFMSRDYMEMGSTDKQATCALLMKLELLLNPKEPDVKELLHLANAIAEMFTIEERRRADQRITELGQKILKAEWIRIKGELR